MVESLRRGGHASEVVLDRLARVQRPAAAMLLPQLAPTNPLLYAMSPTGGYGGGGAAVGAGAGVGAVAPKAGSLLAFVMAEKAKHPDKVLLVRVGDFFESFGADAVMLVEHAGLNPMGGRARAGCPWRNVQATLDGLVGNVSCV